MADVREAAQGVADAILDPGRSPDYHRFMLGKLRREWPTLYGAVMHLVTEVERERKVERSAS